MNNEKSPLLFAIAIAAAFLPDTVFSQETIFQKSSLTANAMYLEILGQGAGLTINYDRLLFPNNLNRQNLAVRAGFGISLYAFTVPVTLSYLLGNKHKAEIGIGLLYGEGGGEISTKEVFPTACLGYRYQNPKGGVIFRIGFTPLYDPNEGLFPYGGLSLGLTF